MRSAVLGSVGRLLTTWMYELAVTDGGRGRAPLRQQLLSAAPPLRKRVEEEARIECGTVAHLNICTPRSLVPHTFSPPTPHKHAHMLALSSICSAFILHFVFNCILESDTEKVEVTET